MYRRIVVKDQAKKRPQAAAIEYDSERDHAPRVTASGSGIIAEQILALAREHQIPLYDDPVLTAALAAVDLGEEIPAELYMVVAEVLAYIYRVTERQSTA